MKKIKKHNNISPKKPQEPIGARIAKAVFEEKKISERIFGYISYDINFVKATYVGKTQRPAKITSIEKGIVGILLVDKTSSFEKIGLILGLDVVNDKAEQCILRTAIETLRGFNAIEGDDSCMALTDAGRTYAEKGERPDTYSKIFDIYVDKSHMSWLNIKNCIGDNNSKIKEINTPCDNLDLTLDEIKLFAEFQAQDVHFPQNRYLLESAIWREGHEASYKVYVCFVQSVASSDQVRAFVFDENTNALNITMSDQINSNVELMSELLEKCIKFECEIEEETVVLEGDDVDVAKSEISEEIKDAEKQLLLEEENAQNANSSNSQVRSITINSSLDKERLHKKALYDSLSFELELQKIFNEDDPDEIWLISPWIRKGAFMHDRGPLIENFLKDENKRVFIAYSEPALNNDGKPMMDEEVEPGIKLLDEQYPNFFYVQLPEFHLKNVIEVKGDQKILFSGSFNVLSFSVSEEQKHIRREEMTLAHHTIAKNKYADFQLEFAEIYASRIRKEIENLEVTSLANYKNERLDYFLNVDNPEIHKLFSPLEDLLEEKTLGCLKEELYKKLAKIGQELVVASNMEGLNIKDKKGYKTLLESISKELSSNSIDDPSTMELLNNNLLLLEAVPEKKIFPGKTQKTGQMSNNCKRNNVVAENASINDFATSVIEGPEPLNKEDLDKHLLALFYCSTRRLINKNALVHTYLKNYIVNYSEFYDGLMIESSSTIEESYDITFIVLNHSFKFRNLMLSDSLREKWSSYINKCNNKKRRLTFVTTQSVESLLTKYKD